MSLLELVKNGFSLQLERVNQNFINFLLEFQLVQGDEHNYLELAKTAESMNGFGLLKLVKSFYNMVNAYHNILFARGFHAISADFDCTFGDLQNSSDIS